MINENVIEGTQVNINEGIDPDTTGDNIEVYNPDVTGVNNEGLEPDKTDDTNDELNRLRDEIKELREFLSKKFTESERGDAGEIDPIEEYLNSEQSITHRILEKYERK